MATLHETRPNSFYFGRKGSEFEKLINNNEKYENTNIDRAVCLFIQSYYFISTARNSIKDAFSFAILSSQQSYITYIYLECARTIQQKHKSLYNIKMIAECLQSECLSNYFLSFLWGYLILIIKMKIWMWQLRLSMIKAYVFG